MSRTPEEPKEAGGPEQKPKPGLAVVAYSTYQEIESKGGGYMDSNQFGGPGKLMKGKQLVLVPMTQQEYQRIDTLPNYVQRVLYIMQIGASRETIKVEIDAEPGLSDRPVVGLVKIPVKVVEKIPPQKQG